MLSIADTTDMSSKPRKRSADSTTSHVTSSKRRRVTTTAAGYCDEIDMNTKSNSADRIRMRPWLETVLDNQQVQGVNWLNKKAGIFQIIWKHGSLHGWTQKDVCVFKLWAIHTGKYVPGNEDTKRWKANFRCALNSLPDAEPVKDQDITRGKNAYRVFRFLQEKKQKKNKSYNAYHPREIQKASEKISTTSASPPTDCANYEFETTNVRTYSKEHTDDHDYSKFSGEKSLYPTPPQSALLGRSFSRQFSGCHILSGRGQDSVVPDMHDAAPMYVKEEEVVTQVYNTRTVPSDEEVVDLIDCLSSGSASPPWDNNGCCSPPIINDDQIFTTADTCNDMDYQDNANTYSTSAAIFSIPTPTYMYTPGDMDQVTPKLSVSAAQSPSSPSNEDMHFFPMDRLPEPVRVFGDQQNE